MKLQSSKYLRSSTGTKNDQTSSANKREETNLYIETYEISTNCIYDTYFYPN